MNSMLLIASNPAGRGARWFGDGFRMFKQSPGAWIGATLIFFLIQFCVEAVPYLGLPLGSCIVSAFLTGGLMLGCNAQHRGEKFKVDFLFRGFAKTYLELLRLGIIYGVLTLLAFIPFLLSGVSLEEVNAGDLQAVREFSLTFLISMAIAVPVMMGYWLAPALVVLDGLNGWEAFKLSFRACLRNIVPALIYGLVALFWIVLGAIPLGLGLLVVLPTLLASTFAAYQHIFKTDNNLV